MIYLIMGVSGCGKSSVGKAVAEKIKCPFHDADSFHSVSNREKMSKGIPLSDEDRLPWLRSLNSLLLEHSQRNSNVVLACSALKKTYRELLLQDLSYFKVVFLKIDIESAQKRLSKRSDHFFNPILLQNQFQTLQEPTTDEFPDLITADAKNTLNSIVDSICWEQAIY